MLNKNTFEYLQKRYSPIIINIINVIFLEVTEWMRLKKKTINLPFIN